MVETDALVECQCKQVCSQKAFKSVFKNESAFSSGPLFPGQSLVDHPPNPTLRLVDNTFNPKMLKPGVQATKEKS